MNQHSIAFNAVLAFSLLFALVGCGPSAQEPTKERLLERANAYWKAGEIRDLTAAYAIEAGSLTGALAPATLKRSLQRSKLLRYEFGDIQIDGVHAAIEVTTDYTVEGIHSTVTTKRRDHWVFTEGDWYHGKTQDSPFVDAPPRESAPTPGATPPASKDPS